MNSSTLNRAPTFVETLNDMSDPYQQESLDQVKAAFAEHELTVLRDDSVYRHLRYRKPGSSMYWFDIHTSPGLLTITGDIGTFVFSRVPDMLSFFADSTHADVPYWQHQLLAPAPQDVIKHDRAAASRAVVDQVTDMTDGWPNDAVVELQRAVDTDLSDALDNEHELLGAILNFEWTSSGDGYTFEFSDPQDLMTRTYTVQYLFACHALRAAAWHYIESGGNVEFTG